MLCYGSPLSTASQYGPSRYCVYCSIAWKPRTMVLVLEVLACFRWHQLQSWLFSIFLRKWCERSLLVFGPADQNLFCFYARARNLWKSRDSVPGIQIATFHETWRNFLFFSPLNFPPYEVRPGIFSGAARILKPCFRICCVTAKTYCTAMTRTVN